MEPKQLPLIAGLSQRYQSLTVDPRLINAFAEKGQAEGEAFVYKRPAFKSFRTNAAGTARGITNWQGNIYAVIDGNVWKNGVNIGAVNNAGVYTFTSCLGLTPVLFLQNGTKAYTISPADAIVTVTNINYPAAVVPGAVYLDGTVYVMDSSSNIYGSTAAGNDPLTWDPLNLIKAQIEPTAGIYLAKQLVYIFALKTGYSEAFYDAGNATGSPLGQVAGAKLNFGCVDAGTVRDVGGDLIWVGNSNEGYPVVILMSNLKGDVVSTPQTERRLASSAGNWYSWNARIEGHRFYGVTSVGADFTLVYDLTSQLWYQWTEVGGHYLPYRFSCQGSGSNTLFLHETDGTIYSLDSDTFVDGTNPPFAVDIYTGNYDGGSRVEKVHHSLEIIGDQVNTNVSVRWSDDDYQTWSTPRVVSMGVDRPITDDLGVFTKRAFNFTHQDTTRVRIKAVNLFLSMGSMP